MPVAPERIIDRLKLNWYKRLKDISSSYYCFKKLKDLFKIKKDFHFENIQWQMHGLSFTGKSNLLRPFFIYSHRKDISHEHNSDAPGKSHPYLIAYRLI